MISRDEAVELLRPLANITSDAFEDALAVYKSLVEAQAGIRKRMEPAVAAVANGVDFWAIFATILREKYELVPGVERLSGPKPLLYRWMIANKLQLQLKSDTTNLPVDQPEIPGVSKVVGGSIEWIALSWDHDQVERFAPAFVHTANGTEVWRVPVVSIAESAAEPIRPAAPKSTVSSAREPAAKGETAESS